MTIISLVVTIIIQALIRSKFRYPPPHRLVLIAKAINRFFICGVQAPEKKSIDDLPNGDAGGIQSIEVAHSADWAAVFIAVHNLICFLFMGLFLLAIVGIYAKRRA